MAENVPLSVDLVEVSREVAVAIQRCQAADAEKLAAHNDLAAIGSAIKATEKDVADLIAGFLLAGSGAIELPPVAEPVIPQSTEPAATQDTPVADAPVEAPAVVDEPALVTEDTFQPPVEAPAAVAAEPEVVAVDVPVDPTPIVNDVDVDEEFDYDNIGADDE